MPPRAAFTTDDSLIKFTNGPMPFGMSVLLPVWLTDYQPSGHDSPALGAVKTQGRTHYEKARETLKAMATEWYQVNGDQRFSQLGRAEALRKAGTFHLSLLDGPSGWVLSQSRLVDKAIKALTPVDPVQGVEAALLDQELRAVLWMRREPALWLRMVSGDAPAALNAVARAPRELSGLDAERYALLRAAALRANRPQLADLSRQAAVVQCVTDCVSVCANRIADLSCFATLAERDAAVKALLRDPVSFKPWLAELGNEEALLVAAKGVESMPTLASGQQANSALKAEL